MDFGGGGNLFCCSKPCPCPQFLPEPSRPPRHARQDSMRAEAAVQLCAAFFGSLYKNIDYEARGGADTATRVLRAFLMTRIRLRPAGNGCWPLPIPRRKTSTKLFVTMVAAYILHRPPASAVAIAIATPLQFTSARKSARTVSGRGSPSSSTVVWTPQVTVTCRSLDPLAAIARRPHVAGSSGRPSPARSLRSPVKNNLTSIFLPVLTRLAKR